MALIFIDGFDNYNNITDLFAAGYSQAEPTNATGYEQTPGRFGLSTGKAMAIAGASGSGILRNLPANYGTFYFGAAVKGQLSMLFFDVTTVQFSLIGTSSTSLSLYRGNQSTLITTVTGAYNAGGWQYLEIGGVVGSSGSMTVKINGNSVLSVSGVNLINTVNSYINGISMGVQTGAAAWDDMYFCDSTTGSGTFPCNTFLGDKRVLTANPTANSSIQFTTASNIVSAGTSTIAGAFNVPTNTSNGVLLLCTANFHVPGASSSTYFNPNFPPPVTTQFFDDPFAGVAPYMNCDGTLTSLTIYVGTANANAKVKPVCVQRDPVTGQPTTILYVGNELTGLVLGPNVLSFAAAANVVKDSSYALGIFIHTTDSSVVSLNYFGPYGGSAPNAMQSFSFTYPGGLPGSVNSSASLTNYTTQLSLTYTYSALTAYEGVSDDRMDGDETYQFSSTVGQVDLFAMTPGLPSTAVVYGVQVTTAARKDDAGARTIKNEVKSVAAVSTGAVQTLGSGYAYFSDMFVLDPNTTATWTATAVNAALIGYTVNS